MKFSTPLLIAILTLPAFAASAVEVVQWGPGTDIVTGNLDAQNNDEGLALVLDGGYSSPDVGPNYYPDNTDRTPNFYGSSDGRLQIRQSSGGDNIGANGNGITSTNTIVLWTNSEFLNGGDTNAATLTGMSAITDDNSSGATTQSRFVIRLDSTFYVSDIFGEGAASFSDPGLLTWNSYDPMTDFTAIGTATPVTDFSNLTGAGIYYTSSLPSAGTIVSELEQFTVTADIAAIPEPATVGLLLGGLACLGFHHLRRRASSVVQG